MSMDGKSSLNFSFSHKFPMSFPRGGEIDDNKDLSRNVDFDEIYDRNSSITLADFRLLVNDRLDVQLIPRCVIKEIVNVKAAFPNFQEDFCQSARGENFLIKNLESTGENLINLLFIRWTRKKKGEKKMKIEIFRKKTGMVWTWWIRSHYSPTGARFKNSSTLHHFMIYTHHLIIISMGVTFSTRIFNKLSQPIWQK